MICRIEALNFRCLRYINQQLNNFEVLVGPNASGKTTFLDVVAFLKDLVTGGLDAAIRNRTQNFEDLAWNHSSDRFELAIELAIPDDLLEKIAKPEFSIVRYEVSIGAESGNGELSIFAEKVLLKKKELRRGRIIMTTFPVEPKPPKTLISPMRAKNTRTIVNKVPGGNDNFYSEVYGKGCKEWAPAFKLGSRKSALGNLPADESNYGAQILLATHSPVILSMASPDQILCFSKTESDAVDIIRGKEHPNLRNWKGETNLGVLFAGGVARMSRWESDRHVTDIFQV